MRRALLTASLVLSWSPLGHAFDICDYYSRYYAEEHGQYCGGGGGGRRVELAGSLPSFADALSLNPASVPTKPTPIGVEVIASGAPEGSPSPKLNFSLLRGFQRIGAAMSSGDDNTFYTNRVPRVAASGTTLTTSGATPALSSLSSGVLPIPTIHFGTSYSLTDTSTDQFAAPSLGLSGRYHPQSGSLGYGIGATVNTRLLSLGAAYNIDPETSSTAGQRYFTLGLGVRAKTLQFDYSFIQNLGELGGDPVHIGTATLTLGAFLLTGAMRLETDEKGDESLRTHFSVQVRLMKRLSLAYLYHYVPGVQSVGAQIFLF